MIKKKYQFLIRKCLHTVLSLMSLIYLFVFYFLILRIRWSEFLCSNDTSNVAVIMKSTCRFANENIKGFFAAKIQEWTYKNIESIITIDYSHSGRTHKRTKNKTKTYKQTKTQWIYKQKDKLNDTFMKFFFSFFIKKWFCHTMGILFWFLVSVSVLLLFLKNYFDFSVTFFSLFDGSMCVIDFQELLAMAKNFTR